MAPDLLGSLDISQMQSLFNDSFNACVPECAGGLGSCFCWSFGASLIDIPPFLLSPGGGGTCQAMALLPLSRGRKGEGGNPGPDQAVGARSRPPPHCHFCPLILSQPGNSPSALCPQTQRDTTGLGEPKWDTLHNAEQQHLDRKGWGEHGAW